MRATVMRNQTLVADEVPTPEPRIGEVLIKTLTCGICGSDLHMLKNGKQVVDALARSGAPFTMNLSRDIVMGHEFCGEIIDYGPQTKRKLKIGTRICSIPFLVRPDGLRVVGYSDETPGGYGEYMRLTEDLLVEVPNGLAAEGAALTEPMAVGLHAVAKARLDRTDVPLVIGCGPIGLAVIAALKLKGAHPIVAADFSPKRRQLAEALGADFVVDPAVNSPYEKWKDVAIWQGPGAPALPPWIPGPPLRPSLIFECVGVPGMIDTIISSVQANSRIVVVGICMQRDYLDPMIAINKELNLQFVIFYSPEEYVESLRNIAEGRIPVDSLVSDRVPVYEIPAAFASLASPDACAKILVEYRD